MKALVAHSIGRGIDGVRLTDVDEPQLGDDDVKIKVAAVSASQLDVSVLRGRIAGVTPPRILGIDPVGTIVEIGRHVDTSRLGTTVVVKPNVVCHRCTYCAAHREADCVAQRMLGVQVDGGAAEYVAVPDWCAFPVPDGVDAVSACAAVHTVPIARHMLQTVAGGLGDLAGSTVLVSGASGAVGSATVQLAHSQGATVIGAIRGLDRADAIRAIGARHVIDIASDTAVDALFAIAPNGVDVAVETTGNGAVAARVFATLGWTGRMVTCAGGHEALPVSLGELYRGRRGLLGVAGSNAGDVVDGLGMVARGAVTPVIDRIVDLADYESAFAALEHGGQRHGRVIFNVAL